MSQPKWVYGAEYALSDRSSCKKCSNGIGKNVVRLCIKSKSRFHDGDDVLWHHPRCFFQKKPNVNVDEIWHFHDLRPEDQARIRKLAMGKGIAVEEDESEGEEEEAPIPKGKGKRGKTSKGSESAKKKQKGNKEDVDDSSLLQQTMLIWKCKDQVSSNIPAAAQKKLLEANDQHIPVAGKVLDRVVDMLLFGATEKCQDCASATGFLVISADAYYCIGHASEWAKCDIRTQEPRRKAPHIPADLLKKYPFLEEYASYQPRRRLFASCFQTNQNGHAVDALKSSVTVVDGPSSSGTPTSRGTVVSSKPRKLAKGKPLKNLKIGVVGKLPMKRTEMNAAIKQLGGAVVTKASKDTFVVISDQASIAARVVMLEMAEVCQVQVVPLDFLEECRGGRIRIEEDLEDLVERIKLSSWKTIKPFERVRAMKQESISLAGLSSSEAHLLSEQRVAARKYTVTDEKMKVLVKNGGAVDPASDLDEKTHSVCKENGIVYSCVLAKTDIQTGSNSFYKLQIIKEDKRSNYYLFRSWGRIGTTIGGNMCEEMEKEDAVSTFEFHFMDKSGNEWKDRERFVKKPSRYFIMELDYGPEEPEQEYTVAPGSKSTLHRAIQDLIKLIFDVEEMKKTMKEFEIDLRKMPLGKLSRRQITDAMKVLSELQLLVQNGERLNSPKMVDASNRFFTLIPHDFGVNAPPLLNQLTVIKEKLEMLDNLLEIEVAFNILRGENRQSDRDPVDQHYEKLKCEMDVVDEGSVEYQHIQSYLENTHAATHSNYKLDLQQVFKVRRQGEVERFAEFKHLHNHKLLWHGSRTTNFAGILSQGLRIAPPEAPVTGYMFGKGVYFADMVSKSANYCFTSAANPVGLMLLSEVALGNMKELKEAKSITRLAVATHSVKGVGRTHPDPTESVLTEDGMEIPLGHAMDSGVQGTSLLYNEYIVYKEAQVHIRYLLQVKFEYHL